MERKKVNSSSIRAVGYDERGRVLEVEFNDGRVNQYSGVAPEVHRRLISAPSIVSYFRDNVEESFPAKRLR
jgi:YD repeat-containing protein